MYQLFGYSGSGNVFFLRKHLSEDQTDEWSAVEDLPEESNREVHECCLTPGSNHITSCVLEQNRCNKTHAGHMMHTIMEEIARVMKIGLSCGVTIRKASICASLSTKANSRTKATGHMIFSSPKPSGILRCSFLPHSGKYCSRS